MANNKKKTNTRGKKAVQKKKLSTATIMKIVAGSLVGVLAILFVLSVLTGGFTDFTFKFGKNKPGADDPNGDHSFVVTPVETEYMSITPMLLAASEDHSIRLTAKLHPENAEVEPVDWTIAFENPDSEWATGKTVTDYVTVTPTEDGALTADVQGLDAFGERIIISVALRSDTSKGGYCAVDYAVRYSFRCIKNQPPTVGEENSGMHKDRLIFQTNRSIGTIDDTVRTLEFRVKKDFIYVFYGNLYFGELSEAVRDFFLPNSGLSYDRAEDIVVSSSTRLNPDTPGSSIYLDMRGLAVQVEGVSGIEPDVVFVGSLHKNEQQYTELNEGDEIGFCRLLGMSEELISQLTNSDKNIIVRAMENAYQATYKVHPFVLSARIASAYYDTYECSTEDCVFEPKFGVSAESVTLAPSTLVF